MSTPIKATRRWTTRRMDTDQQSPLEGTPTLWPTQYGPHDEEVFVIKASDLKALANQATTAVGELRHSGYPVTHGEVGARVMEALGLIPTLPRRKGRTR